VRTCWLELCDSGERAYCEPGFTADLRRRYAGSLSALVARRWVDAAVAGHIGVAFGEAVTHVQRKQTSCYEPIPQGAANPYPPREEVVTQAAALAEMADRSGIAPETVATAQAALARDMAWLDQFRAGGNPGEMAAVDATPVEIEAARVLVALLLKTE
jgi:hypothetical protein